MAKVTFTEAAKVTGLHRNTLRNWREAGKLTSAEKVIEKGVVKWLVELSEVERIANQQRQTYQASPDNIDSPPNDQPTYTSSPGPGVSGSLAVIPATAFERLVSLVESQGERLERLARENGELAAKVAALESRLQEAIASDPPAPPAQAPDQRPTARPAPESKKRRWPWSLF